MIDYKKVIKNRELRLKLISFLSFVPDELYIKIVFKIKTGKRLNLKNPQTFNEKLNWLKLHGKREEYTDLADSSKQENIFQKRFRPIIFFRFSAYGTALRKLTLTLCRKALLLNAIMIPAV